MSQVPQPLFVDTNALVAAFDEDDSHYEVVNDIFDGIRDRELPYGPLFTSRFVIAETATTILAGVGHREAVDAVTTVRTSSSFNVIEVDTALFEKTVDQFVQYNDQTISFVDHMNAVLADEFDISHIFAFDQHFATLGLTRVPVDTSDP